MSLLQKSLVSFALLCALLCSTPALAQPAISLPTQVNVSVATGLSKSVSFNIGNAGATALNYTVNPQTTVVMFEAGTTAPINAGLESTVYSNLSQNNLSNANFAADDFVVIDPLPVASLSVEGFTNFSGAFADYANAVVWSIYPDANGVPAGDPLINPSAAVWTYGSPLNAAGLTVPIQNGRVTLDLAAAGQSLTLQPGRYWLVVHTQSPNPAGWVRWSSPTPTGNAGVASLNVSRTNTGSWTTTAFRAAGLSVRITSSCGASWISAVSPASGSLAPTGTQATSFVVNASALAIGTYTAALCIPSNDPARPVALVPVSLTVTARASLNIDNSDPGTIFDAATDGVLLVRYLFGYRGADLIAGARGTGASLRDAAQIEAFFTTFIPANQALSQFDVDGDGVVLPMTDGLMILRRLLNPAANGTLSAAEQTAITANAKQGTLTNAQVVQRIEALKP
ncbi:MAG: hypothetical protein ACRCWJ_08920 [Casimicrobium sp.]